MAMQGQVPSVRISPVRAVNAVALNGPRLGVDLVADAIEQLDRAPAQIAFDVEILEADSEDLQMSGVDWTNPQGYPMFSLTLKETEPKPAQGGNQPDLLSFRPWARTSLEIAMQLRLLARSGKAKVLARPSITTLENKTARILTGDRYTIVINQTGGGSTWQQLQYIDAGIRLELTPRLDSGGGIVVSLMPQISAVTGFSREGYPVLSTREAQTTVRLTPGETLIIGGLMRTESSEEQSGLPILSRVPVVGELCGSKRKNLKTTELIILVMPRVMRELTTFGADSGQLQLP